MPDDRSRTEKLIGMLGSPFDGERANAAGLLQREASQKKLSLVEFLRHALRVQGDGSGAHHSYRDEPRGHHRGWRDGGGVLDGLMQATRWTSVLSEWEAGFAADVSRRYARDSELSDKQVMAGQKIIAKARRAALAGVRPDEEA